MPAQVPSPRSYKINDPGKVVHISMYIFLIYKVVGLMKRNDTDSCAKQSPTSTDVGEEWQG